MRESSRSGFGNIHTGELTPLGLYFHRSGFLISALRALATFLS